MDQMIFRILAKQKRLRDVIESSYERAVHVCFSENFNGPIVMLAAVLMTLGVTLPHDRSVLAFSSVILGATGLVLLAGRAKDRPVLVLAMWGAVFVPLSGSWVIPAFDDAGEALGVWLGLALCGVVFYGGFAMLFSLVLHGRFERVRFLILPLAIPFAEYMAMKVGLVVAPVGLFAVVGGWAWGVALFGTIASGGVLMCIASVYAITSSCALRASIAFSAVLLTIAPPPIKPDYSGLPIYSIAHNPDPTTKWTAQGAQDGLSTLISRSREVRDSALIVWPENAVSGTFDVKEAIDLLNDVPKPLLFGMTRFVEAGSPISRNSAILIENDGVQISDKIVLAPIMEAGIPFGSQPDLEVGKRRLMTLQGATKILPLICYEIAFPIAASDLEVRPDVIITIAAQTGFIAWIADPIAQRHARARELETGIRVIRVSDAGSY